MIVNAIIKIRHYSDMWLFYGNKCYAIYYLFKIFVKKFFDKEQFIEF